MAKVKTIYSCSDCGAQSPKWVGQCPDCGAWNTLIEGVDSKVAQTGRNAVYASLAPVAAVQALASVEPETISRLVTGSAELDRVLGGGLVPGSVVLIGGDPGIGKSTLALQLALGLKNLRVLYTSGEESLQQIKLRAERLNVKKSNCLFLCETSLEHLIAHTEQTKPNLLITNAMSMEPLRSSKVPTEA